MYHYVLLPYLISKTFSVLFREGYFAKSGQVCHAGLCLINEYSSQQGIQ